MKRIIIAGLIFAALIVSAQTTKSIIDKVDKNMSSKNRIIEASMTISGRRNSRTLTSKSWSEGNSKSFTEYLSPAAEKGTKMLKLNGQLWIYTPSTDRTIQISGNMLKQSLMGSDLSYEDMMDDRKLQDQYSEKLVGRETVDGRGVYVIQLTAKVNDVAYFSQKMWVDSIRFVPLKQELYAKSGQLLKKVEYRDVRNVQGRWFPFTTVYKDMLKEGKGTEFTIINIKFDQQIPDYIFSKASLKK